MKKNFFVAKLLVSVVFFISLSMLIHVDASEAPMPYVNSDYRPDFKKDDVAAKKYAEKKYTEFEKKLTNDEKQLILDLKDHNYEFLKTLNDARDYQSSHMGSNPIIFQKIEGLFDKRSLKTNSSHVLYASFSMEDLGIKVDNIDDGTSINQKEFVSFINQFQYFNVNGNFLGSLVQKKLQRKERILLKLTIPKNEKMIFFKDGKAMIDSDVGIIAKRVSIFSEGREYIRLEGDLVPKEKINQELISDNNVLNQQFNKIYSVQRNDVVKIDAKSYRTNYAVAKGKEMIDNFIDVIPKFLVDKIIQENKYGDFQIIVYDREIPNAPSSAAALFDYTINKIEMNAMYIEGSVFIHEFGHAVDYNLLGKGNVHFSKTDSFFSDLFDKEKDNLTSELSEVDHTDSNGKQILYGQTSLSEYFAEVFKNMYSTDPALKALIWQKTPETCLYLQQKISSLS